MGFLFICWLLLLCCVEVRFLVAFMVLFPCFWASWVPLDFLGVLLLVSVEGYVVLLFVVALVCDCVLFRDCCCLFVLNSCLMLGFVCLCCLYCLVFGLIGWV